MARRKDGCSLLEAPICGRAKDEDPAFRLLTRGALFSGFTPLVRRPRWLDISGGRAEFGITPSGQPADLSFARVRQYNRRLSLSSSGDLPRQK